MDQILARKPTDEERWSAIQTPRSSPHFFSCGASRRMKKQKSIDSTSEEKGHYSPPPLKEVDSHSQTKERGREEQIVDVPTPTLHSHHRKRGGLGPTRYPQLLVLEQGPVLGPQPEPGPVQEQQQPEVDLSHSKWNDYDGDGDDSVR